MSIGNLTSQFFANVYLHELDLFAKHTLKAEYYLRYVDDFVILHKDKKTLLLWKGEIDNFLKETLKIELHPEKSRIIRLDHGVTLLGFRVYKKYRLLKKSNSKQVWKRIELISRKYKEGKLTMEKANSSLEGWFAYAKFASTYKLRKRVAARFDELFDCCIEDGDPVHQ